MSETVSIPSGDGPLAGFVVVDLSRVLAGPYCTQILLDLGADVIKVEQPGVGDDSRILLPMIDGESAYFAGVNRGKRSIALDLKVDEDRAIFEKMLDRADVLVENFRPGVLDKLGYGWDTVKARWPRLVLASISGFGQDGPNAKRPAYDLIVQAMSGLMSITGYPDMPPARSGTSTGDVSAGAFGAIGVQAALLQRVRTGKGAHVDISMLDCQISLLENAVSRYIASGEVPGPLGARHPTAAPFDAFRTRDGYIVITAARDVFFKPLVAELGIPEVAEDPRFNSFGNRIANVDALKPILEGALAVADSAEWLDRLAGAKVPAGPVYDIPDMIDDPQVQARGILANVAERPGLKLAATPVIFDGRRYPETLPPPPGLDQHRAAVLRWVEDEA